MSKAKDKKPTDVLVAWCIDRSGSMGGFERDTIEGFNAFVTEQQKLPGNMWLSLVLFDDTFQAPIVAVDINEVKPLDSSTYHVGGMTALYDAVGVTINGVEGWLKNNPSFKGKVIVNIWTDGGENASVRWARDAGRAQMMDAIRAKRDAGWEFAFLGSGGAAWTEGQHFVSAVGASNTTQTTHTHSGVRTGYAGASMSASAVRSTGEYVTTNASVNNFAATSDSATTKEVLANFGIDDIEEALSGTTNVTE